MRFTALNAALGQDGQDARAGEEIVDQARWEFEFPPKRAVNRRGISVAWVSTSGTAVVIAQHSLESDSRLRLILRGSAKYCSLITSS